MSAKSFSFLQKTSIRISGDLSTPSTLAIPSSLKIFDHTLHSSSTLPTSVNAKNFNERYGFAIPAMDFTRKGRINNIDSFCASQTIRLFPLKGDNSSSSDSSSSSSSSESHTATSSPFVLPNYILNNDNLSASIPSSSPPFLSSVELLAVGNSRLSYGHTITTREGDMLAVGRRTFVRVDGGGVVKFKDAEKEILNERIGNSVSDKSVFDCLEERERLEFPMTYAGVREHIQIDRFLSPLDENFSGHIDHAQLTQICLSSFY